MVKTIDEKLQTNTAITTSELGLLRVQLKGDHEDMLQLLQQKFDAMDLLSLEQDITDIKVQLNEVAQKEDDILENEIAILDGVQDIKVILGKVLSDQNLNKKEQESRQQLLSKLRLANASSLRYLNNNILGQGGFGTVRLAIYKNTTKVAIKDLKALDRSTIEGAENEILLMHYIGVHPNILACYGYYKDEATKDIHIVLEYAPYNSLSSILYDTETFPHLSVRLIVGWLSDLASALEHVHSRKVKHRDVKAENMLVFEGLKVKLCDFGLAKEHSSQRATHVSNVGTDGFKAPEVYSMGALYASDVYSWAMTAYQMMMRRVPKVNVAPAVRVKNMITVINEDDELSAMSFGKELLCRTIQRCADIDHNNRPSMVTVSQEMQAVCSALRGDPRLKLSDSDESYITGLEATIIGKIKGIVHSPSKGSSHITNNTVTDSVISNNISNTIPIVTTIDNQSTESTFNCQTGTNDATFTSSNTHSNIESSKHNTITTSTDNNTCQSVPVNDANLALRSMVNLWFSDRDIALERYGDISTWDTSKVTDMRELFKDRTDFNYEDIMKWDLTNVTDTTDMFKGVKSFDSFINSMKVSPFSRYCFLW